MRTIKEALEDGSISLEDEIDYPDMTEEEYKEEIEKLNKERNKTYENGLNYFLELQEKKEENKRLHSIIKEVREYCLEKAKGKLEKTLYDDILEILDKVDKENI